MDRLPTTGFAEDPGGPPSTVTEVWDTSLKAQRDIANPLSRQKVLDDEYDKRIAAVEGATGIRLSHPRRDGPGQDDWTEAREDPDLTGWRSSVSMGAAMQKAELRFHRDLTRLAEQHPDKAEAIRAGTTVWDDAYARVREAERRSEDATRRSSLSLPVPIIGDLNPVGIAGSFYGFLHDPINWMTMVLGPGGSAAKGILWNASRQAVAGAVQQAAIEPFVQQWRREAGLDYGFSQAAQNVLFAGVAGGAIDAVGRSVGRAAMGRPLSGVPGDSPAGSRPPGADPVASAVIDAEPLRALPGRLAEDPLDALEAGAARLPQDNLARRAAEGDARASVELVEKLGLAADDPAVRGALDATRLEILQEENIAGFMHAAEVEDRLARAIRQQMEPETNPPLYSAPGDSPAGSRPPGADLVADVDPIRLQTFRDGELDPLDAAALLRERPELAAELPPTTETARGIHALSRLSDAGFERVLDGRIAPEMAAIVADAAPAARHADMLDRLVSARPRDADEARRLVAEMTQRPLDAETASVLLTGSDSAPGGRLPAGESPGATRNTPLGADPVAGAATPERLKAGEFIEPVGEGAKRQADSLQPMADRAQAMGDLRASLRGQDVTAAATPEPRPRLDISGTALAPRFLAGEAAIADELMAQAVKTLPPAVRVKIEDNIRVGNYELNGYFDRRDNILAIALDAGDPAATFSHERIHALKAHGLFTDSEWRLLVDSANTRGIRQEMGRETLEQYRQQLMPTMVREQLAARGVTEAVNMSWPDLEPLLIKHKLLDKADPEGSLTRARLWDETRLQALIDEEAVAFLAEKWRAGEKVPARVAKVLERIMQFLERVRNVLAGHGFQTVDDLFQRIDSGEVAMRALRDVELPGGAKVRGIPFFTRGGALADMRAAIRAFHGSPHDFDRFSLDKIGTGEGAQAYGHGLYFAESEGVAKFYRNVLSPGWNASGNYDLSEVGRSGRLAMAHGSVQGDIDAAITFARTKLNDESAAQELLRAKQKLLPPTGRLYEVNIKADPNDFLDWDKPLSQQSEKVRKAAQSPLVAEYMKARRDAVFPRSVDETGEILVRAFGASGGEAAASAALREAGIPGIKYLDQSSRAAGEGSRNYVVFDDNLIEIVAKDGQPVGPPRVQDALDAAKAEADAGALVAACKLA